MSDLKSHLKNGSIRQVDFATQLGVTQGTISRLCAGTALPSLDLAFAIERETGGAVPASSWLAAPPEAPAEEDAA